MAGNRKTLINYDGVKKPLEFDPSMYIIIMLMHVGGCHLVINKLSNPIRELMSADSYI